MKKILILCAAFLTSLSKIMFGQDKPNILFVYIDDLGYGDLHCYGSRVNESPGIDRLADEGIRFTSYYSSAPISSPSRVAVLTGQFPARWGITSFINDSKANRNRGMRNFLDLSAPSVARNLKEAGYYTAHIGKWHMGGGRDIGNVPYISEYGFDESVTQFEGIGERYLAKYETLNLPDSTRPLEKMSAKLGRGEVHWAKRENFTQIYVDRAIKAIENSRAANKPFYINLWPDDPHIPLEPPRELRGNGLTPALYKGVIKEMDRHLARIFDYIRNNPELKRNTIIIFSSDNGPAKNVGSAGGFRGFKGNLYEGGISEPFIVWAPGIIPAKKQGTVDEVSVLAGVDLAPSIITIAGATKTQGVTYDGIDASGIFLGKEQTIRKKSLFWMRPPGTPLDYQDLAIREGNYKLLINIDGTRIELYNIKEDRPETKNLAGSNPELTARLKKEVLDWYSEMPPLVDRKQVSPR